MTFAGRLRPSILDRYVMREILPPTGLGLLLFTFILLLDQITNLLRILVSRGADLPTIVRALVYLLPSIFSVTIPMAFLLGVLLAFGRLASESEIIAMRASGISPLRLLRPVMAAAALATTITFYVVAVALPAANQAYREIVFALVMSKARTGVVARVFNDELIPGRNMVLYVSDIPAETGEWRDVFIYDMREPQQPNVILARAGRLIIDKDRKNIELDLREGTRYRFRPAAPEELEQQKFSSGRFPLPYAEFFPAVPLAKGDREMSLQDLKNKVAELQSQGKAEETGRYMVEYHKKFAIPAACVVFGLLGLGLSLGSKKEARSAAFGLSIAVIFVYYVIIRLGEQAGDTGMLSPAVAMWGANAVLGTAALVLLVLNLREAAFDPLDPMHYLALLPAIRRRARLRESEPAAAPVAAVARRRPPTGARPGVPARGRKVVVVRIPRMALPIPGILDRYVARSWAGMFALVISAFWALYILVNFMDLFDDIQQNKVKGKTVLHFYLFKSPDIIQLLTPVAVLVAVLITFGIMARRHEITAMKAAGISVYRTVLPALGLGLAVSVLMFAASEYLIPALNRVAAEDLNRIKGRPPQSSSILQNRWVLGSDGKFYNFDYMEKNFADPAKGTPDGVTFYGLSVYDVDAKTFELNNRLYAARATWNGVSYDLERGWRRSFRPLGFKTLEANRRTREIDPPNYFRREERDSDTLSFKELRAQIGALEKLGLDVTKLRVEMHRKLSFPMVSLIMTLAGIPFAFVVSRRGALYGVAASLVLAIVYWAFLGIFEALGNYAVLPPVLAAWTPNVLFGATGLYFTLTLET